MNKTLYAYAEACYKVMPPLCETTCGLTEFVTEKKSESC